MEINKIFCPGGYTWFDKGDAAQIMVMADNLRKCFPRAEATFVTATPELDAQKLGIDTCPNIILPYDRRRRHYYKYLFEKYISWRLAFIRKKKDIKKDSSVRHALCYLTEWRRFWLMLIRTYIWCKVLRRKPDGLFNDDRRKTMAKFIDCDIVIFVPGGYIMTNYPLHTSWLPHIYFLFLAKMFNKKVVMDACTIGGFSGIFNRQIASYILNMAELIIFRDAVSMKAVSELKIDRPKKELTADVSFLLGVCPEEGLESILKAENIKKDGNLFVALAVKYLAFNKDRGSPTDSDNYIECMRKIVDHVAGRYGASVFFMPQNVEPGEFSDIKVAEKIVSGLACGDKVKIISGDYSPLELKGLYSIMDITIGVRLHSIMFSLSAQVPALALAYEKKIYGIMDMLALSDYVLDVHDLDYADMERKIDRLIAQRSIAKQYLAEVMPKMRSMAGENYAIIRNCLKGL